MGRKLTKSQKRKLKEKHQKNKIKKLESLDRRGLSRKKYSFVMKPKTLFIMKVIGIVAIPVVYFVYSPLLVLVMIYFVSLFFFAIATEHSLNITVIRSNHIKIPKYDSAIALVLVCVAFFGTVFSETRTRVGMFTNTWQMKVRTFFDNFGSLLTGRRSIFGTEIDFRFGSMERPEGFVPNKEEMMDRFEGMADRPADFQGFSGRPPRMELNMDDIPIEFMFSQLLSTIATVLLVITAVFAILSLYVTYKKIKRFNQEQQEVVVDGEILLLDDEQIFKILDFGVVEE